jgi:hypothetical protein
MLDRIRTSLDYLLGAEALTQEHEQFRAQMSELERRQLETDALTAELEARVAVLEQGHANDAVA